MGKGGGGGGQTSSTVTNTNIPEYARGYVENMLMGTQRQLFTGNEGEGGAFDITGFKPYKAYGGTYDQSGNMTSYDPSASVAGFTPMQQMAQNGIYNMQMPGQFNAASGYTADAMRRASNAGYGPSQFTMERAQAPGLNYFQMDQPQDVAGEQAGRVRLAAAPQARAAYMQAAQMDASPEMAAAAANQTQLAQAARMRSEQAGITQLGQANTYQGQQLNYKPQDVGYDRVNAPNLRDLQMQGAANVGTQSFTQPGAAQSYMSPYMQNVVDIQQREAQRQADIAATRRSTGLAQAGAFGGGRHAIENAEAARNLATQKGDIQAQGQQAAFQAAQGQFNTEQQAALNAALANQQVQQQTGVQNLSAALQTQGLGAQTGLTAQQLNQAAGMQTGQFNQQQGYNTALQNAQLAQQQQLANQSLQGQYGLQQGQMNQAVSLQNAAQRQAANAANQGALNQFGLQQGQMDQATALQNAQMRQQAAANNQQYAAQYGLQGGQFRQAANAANQQAANQIALANQQMTGQYGLTQGQMDAARNQFNAQQRQAANLANQQMAFNTGSQNLQAGLGVQQLGAGQDLQSQLANQQMRLNTQQAGEQSRQFGANYGQQMNAQQLAAAQQLAGIGGQQLTAQQGIYGLQNQYGGQQQQMQQQIINQAMQDYSNAQQYPLMQLGTMSNMLRGLPMQASTTNMYQAAPNAITQGIGAVGAYGALNNAFGAPTGGAGGARPYKEGGAIRGGIMSYDVGGEIESTLSKMGVDDLKRYAKESSSPSIKQMAARLIQEKSMPVPRMARGGILAFAKSTEENNRSLVKELREASEEGLASPDELTATDVQYAPNKGFGGALTKLLADRHAESFGTRPTTSASPPEPPPPPPPSPFAAGPDVNPQDVRLANARSPAPPAPPAPPPQGIAQAAAATAPPRPPAAPRPSAPPAPPPSAGISAPSYPNRPEIPDTPEHAAYRAQAAAANANANKTVAQHLEDIKAEQVAAGLEPENKAIQDYRARMMAERANMDDEAKRQKNLRLAEFFASWGSTPGATLVAGMTALKKTIPTLIEDEKERKKATREADKIIYELDQAVRLEKKGDINAATDRKQNAAKIAEPYNSTLAKLSQEKTTAAINAQGDMARFASSTFNTESTRQTHLDTTRMSNESAEKIARIKASADLAAVREAAKARETGKIGTLYQGALELVRHTQADIDNRRKTDPSYVMALRIANAPEPSNTKDKAAYEKAKQDVVDWETEQAKRLVLPMARVEALGRELSGSAPASTDTPTTMTRADVERVAKERNKTVAEVEAAAKAKGITIR